MKQKFDGSLDKMRNLDISQSLGGVFDLFPRNFNS